MTHEANNLSCLIIPGVSLSNKHLRRLRHKTAGAVSTEYAFLMAFIAIVAAAGMATLGAGLNQYFSSVATVIGTAASQTGDPANPATPANASGEDDGGDTGGSEPPADDPSPADDPAPADNAGANGNGNGNGANNGNGGINDNGNKGNGNKGNGKKN